MQLTIICITWQSSVCYKGAYTPRVTKSESPGVGGFRWSRSQNRNLKQLWSRTQKKMPDSEKKYR